MCKRLSETLCPKCYQRLIDEFGGQRIWIPKKGNLGYRDEDYFHERNARILAQLELGKSAEIVAKSFRLSEKRVLEILYESGANGRGEPCGRNGRSQSRTRKRPLRERFISSMA